MSLGFSFAALVIGALVLLATLLYARRRPPLPPPAEPVRLSRLCAAAFFFSLVAAITVLASLLTAEAVAYRDLANFSDADIRTGRKAAEALLLAAMVPAFAALAFAIAGRGAVRESGGALRGRALYRAALLISLCVGLLAWSRLSSAGFTAARPAGL